jgi:outer membrane protein assembly factor BamB
MMAGMIERVFAAGLSAVLFFGAVPLSAAETGSDAWWPEFHGPRRDNISPEKGLLKKWPEEGPELIWKYPECGGGYSMVSVADGMIFTAGDFGDREMLIALNMDGKLLWTSPNGASWNGPHPGSRTTPTYHRGLLYHMNPTGRLAAYRAPSGKQIWSVDLQSEFGARYGTWAMAENVVVEGDLLLCVPGGSKALVAALNKHTGETVWVNTELKEVAAYCSPVLVTYQGVRQMITLTQKSVVGVDVHTGKLLWSYPHLTRHDQNVTSPVFSDGYVFVTSGHFSGGRLLEINPNLHDATEVWYRKSFDNCHGGVILVDGCLYGSGCRKGGKDFFCVDFLTGKERQVDRTLNDKLSLACADGMLYGLSYKGKMWLMAITPGGFSVVSQFDVPRKSKDLYLSQPVICGGRLYLRHDRNLYAYDIRAESSR